MQTRTNAFRRDDWAPLAPLLNEARQAGSCRRSSIVAAEVSLNSSLQRRARSSSTRRSFSVGAIRASQGER